MTWAVRGAASGGGGGGGSGAPASTVNYTYDAVGNRLTANSTTYTYGNAEELLTAGGVSYGYDARGNQTSRGSDTFTWDHENRMKQLTIGGATSSYTYNGDGLRVSQTTGGSTTNYVWDVAASLPVVLQDGTNTYVYGLGLISTTDAIGVQTYRLTDALGSTINLCDGTGAVLVTYAYGAFGDVRHQSSGSTNVWKFTGEQRDNDPTIGRFINDDPLGGGYPYGANNPANMIDPSGLIPIWNCTTYGETPDGMPACAGGYWWDDTPEVVEQFGGMGQPSVTPSDVVFEEEVADSGGGGCSGLGLVSCAVDTAGSVAAGMTDLVVDYVESAYWAPLSTTIQLADLLPWATVPGVGTTIGYGLDGAAWVVFSVDIALSKCDEVTKASLRALNNSNLAIGLLGNFTPPTALIASAAEGGMYFQSSRIIADC